MGGKNFKKHQLITHRDSDSEDIPTPPPPKRCKIDEEQRLLDEKKLLDDLREHPVTWYSYFWSFFGY